MGEFTDEGFTEAANLVFGGFGRIEIRAALATADGKSGEGIFKRLFKAEKGDDRRGDGRIKPETAFVWAEFTVKLDAVALIDS